MINGCGQTEAAPHPTPGIKQKTCSHSITKPKFSLEEVLFPSVTGSGHSAQAIRVGSTTFTLRPILLALHSVFETVSLTDYGAL